MEGGSLIFITGGVRSGKSSFAERFATETAAKTNSRLNYIATGVPFDKEMEKRIDKHRQDRSKGPIQWITREQPVNIRELASSFNNQDVILLDCVTTLVNNELFSLGENVTEDEAATIYKRIFSGIAAIRKNCRQLVLVSNEVLQEPYSEDKLLFIYRKLLGSLHREIVRIADEAYLVEAGVPILMKTGQGQEPSMPKTAVDEREIRCGRDRSQGK